MTAVGREYHRRDCKNHRASGGRDPEELEKVPSLGGEPGSHLRSFYDVPGTTGEETEV